MQHTSRIALAIALATLFGRLATQCQTQPAAPSDEVAIKQAALDYIEGWYQGDAARMERALHPELAKRMVSSDSRGRSRLTQMSAMTLVQNTRAGGGNRIPKDQHQKDIIILDRFNKRGGCEDRCFRLGGLIGRSQVRRTVEDHKRAVGIETTLGTTEIFGSKPVSGRGADRLAVRAWGNTPRSTNIVNREFQDH